MFLVLFEFTAGTLIAVFFITQVLVPLVRGMPLFPLFHGERKLESELARAKEEAEKAEIRREIKEEKENIRRKS